MSQDKEGEFGKDMERHVAIAVLKADNSGIIEVVREAINHAGEVIGIVNPKAGLALKTTALLGGWLWNGWKYERAKPAIQAVAERVAQVGGDYVKKDEFADILEETLRR